MTGSDKCQISLIDQENGKIIHYKEQPDKVLKPTSHENHIGVVGQVARTGQKSQILDPQKHAFYNQLVDIDTQMPIITIPINSIEDGRIVAVFQIVNIRGIIGKNQDKMDMLDVEILSFYSEIIAICIQRIEQLNSKLEANKKDPKNPQKQK